MKRSDLLQLIEAALAAQQPTYARQAAQRYLADWPGDLGMQFTLARACAAEGDAQPAAAALEALVAADPEASDAQRLLGDQWRALKMPEAAILAYASAHMGDGLGAPKDFSLPDWAAPARAACLAERIGDWETARRESEPILKADIPSPLPSLVHLCALWHAGQLDLALPLAEGFHARWPQVVAFKLCLAECLLKNGGRARALELLHDATAQDAAGQVAQRHWGAAHPYAQLWASELSAPLPGPLPAALITALGLNRLTGATAPIPNSQSPITTPQSQKASSHSSPISPSSRASEEIAEIQSQLDALAERLQRRKSKSQLPITDYHYLILSSRTHLIQAFDLNGFMAIDDQLKTLAANAAARAKMRAGVLYVDDQASLKTFGLKPVNPANAWDIKTLLGDLAAQLKQKNAAIGALLIVGGADIIPFHHLPNPTDDPDPDIPSDNPYATPDENYFVPEWPVGRIPSGAGKNPEPLLRALQNAAKNHSDHTQRAATPRNWLVRLWLRLTGHREEIGVSPSFGYSANVWKHVSLAVYTTIGDPRNLLTCPPVDATALPAGGLAPSRLSYFNLHGIEDGPEWYGQRSAEDFGSAPEYPVALRPADVSDHGRAPAIVFSEACYGANILGKTVEDALCLRFLDSGSRAMVASTKIAYGAVTTPLIGADLLGFYFWQNVTEGLPAGEALRRAKLQMAQEMHERQGFLDGEDQKTLIEFVLYGDPLAAAPGVRPAKRAKQASPLREPPPTVCDKSDEEASLTPEAVARIKSVVAQYLPGMGDAQWRVAHSHAQCTAKHNCPTAHLAKFQKPPVRHMPHTTVVTLSKTLRANARAHPHYARVTLDENGAVVKLAVSR